MPETAVKPKRGRPPAPNKPARKMACITAEISHEELDLLTQSAEKDLRSKSVWIRIAIQEKLKRDAEK